MTFSTLHLVQFLRGEEHLVLAHLQVALDVLHPLVQRIHLVVIVIVIVIVIVMVISVVMMLAVTMTVLMMMMVVMKTVVMMTSVVRIRTSSSAPSSAFSFSSS